MTHEQAPRQWNQVLAQEWSAPIEVRVRRRRSPTQTLLQAPYHFRGTERLTPVITLEIQKS